MSSDVDILSSLLFATTCFSAVIVVEVRGVGLYLRVICAMPYMTAALKMRPSDPDVVCCSVPSQVCCNDKGTSITTPLLRAGRLYQTEMCSVTCSCQCTSIEPNDDVYSVT